MSNDFPKLRTFDDLIGSRKKKSKQALAVSKAAAAPEAAKGKRTFAVASQDEVLAGKLIAASDETSSEDEDEGEEEEEEEEQESEEEDEDAEEDPRGKTRAAGNAGTYGDASNVISSCTPSKSSKRIFSKAPSPGLGRSPGKGSDTQVQVQTPQSDRRSFADCRLSAASVASGGDDFHEEGQAFPSSILWKYSKDERVSLVVGERGCKYATAQRTPWEPTNMRTRGTNASKQPTDSGRKTKRASWGRRWGGGWNPFEVLVSILMKIPFLTFTFDVHFGSRGCS